MHHPDNDHRHAVALFRYGLIAELVRQELGAKGLYAQMDEFPIKNNTTVISLTGLMNKLKLLIMTVNNMTKFKLIFTVRRQLS